MAQEKPETPETIALVNSIDEALSAAIAKDAEKPDPAIGREIGRLVSLFVRARNENDADTLIRIQFAAKALNAKAANLEFVQFLRSHLENRARVREPGIVAWITKKLRYSAVYSMLMGLVYSSLFWGAMYVGIALVIRHVSLIGDHAQMPIAEVGPLLLAALIGSIASLLTRTNEFGSLTVFDPFLVFVNAFVKPLIGTIFALVAYAAFKSQVVGTSALNFKDGELLRYGLWVIGFLSGFSERFAGDIVARAGNVLTAAPSPK